MRWLSFQEFRGPSSRGVLAIVAPLEVMDNARTCEDCGVSKPETKEYFNYHVRRGWMRWCIACGEERRKAQRRRDAEKLRSAHLPEAGVTPTPEEVQRWVKLWNEGLTVAAILTRSRFKDRAVVSRHLRQALGVKLLPRR